MVASDSITFVSSLVNISLVIQKFEVDLMWRHSIVISFLSQISGSHDGKYEGGLL
jgi:hypothetical protein